MSILIDTNSLNDSLEIGKTYAIPIIIKYWTDTPEKYNKYPRVFNLFLFDNINKPDQTIHLKIEGKNKHTEVYFAESNLSINIPIGNESYSVKTYLIIRCNQYSSAFTNTFEIIATSKKIGRINSFETSEVLVYRPEYVPNMEIKVPNQDITISNSKKIIPIKIKNTANKKSRITPIITNGNESFQIKFSPPFIDLQINESKYLNLSVNPKNEFNYDKMINITLKMQMFPIDQSAKTNLIPLNFSLSYEKNFINKSNDSNYILYFLSIIMVSIILLYFLFIK